MRTLAVRMIGIQHRANVADRSREDLVGIGIQADVRLSRPRRTMAKIIFVNVAQNPDVRQVGNRKRIGRAEALRRRRRW